jgi:hypothetical protein
LLSTAYKLLIAPLMARGWGRNANSARNNFARSRRHGSYEKNQHLLGASQCASACLGSLPSLQRTQSPVRKRQAGPHHRIAVCHHDFVHPSAARLCTQCVRFSVCFVFSCGHQRDEANHVGHKQYPVAGHNHYRRDLRSRNSECNGQHSGRKLGRLGLYERWE